MATAMHATAENPAANPAISCGASRLWSGAKASTSLLAERLVQGAALAVMLAATAVLGSAQGEGDPEAAPEASHDMWDY